MDNDLLSETVELLRMTFAAHSSMEISYATTKLQEFSKDVSFLSILHQIVLRADIDQNLRLSALIRMTQILGTFWNLFDKETIKMIIEIVPTTLSVMINAPSGQLIEFSRKIIMNCFPICMYDNIFDDINTLLSNHQTILAGYYLLYSLVLYLTSDGESYLDQQSVVDPLLNILIPNIKTCNDHNILTWIFRVLAKLVHTEKFTYFDGDMNNLLACLQVPCCIEKALIGDSSNEFCDAGAHLIFVFVQRYLVQLEVDVIQMLFNMILRVLQSRNGSFYTNYYLFKCIHLFCLLEGFYEYFIENIISDITNTVILPHLSLNEVEIEISESDPYSFIVEVYKEVEADDFDVRCVIFNIISRFCGENENALMAIYTIFLNLIQSFSNSSCDRQSISLYFGGCLMFSYVSKEFSSTFRPKFIDLISKLIPFFESEHALVRAGAYMLLNRVSGRFPKQWVVQCLVPLTDQSPLVRYYAFKSALKLVKKMDTDEGLIELKEELKPHIQSIFESLLECSNIFHDGHFIRGVNNFIELFDEQLVPLIEPIVDNMLRQLTFSCESSGFINEFCNEVIFSIQMLLELLRSRAQSITLYVNQLFIKLVNIIKLPIDMDTLNCLLELAYQVLKHTSFDEVFWIILEPILNHYDRSTDDVVYQDLVDVLLLLIVRDSSFATRKDIVSQIIEFMLRHFKRRIDELDSWSFLATLASGIIFKIDSDSSLIDESFKLILDMLMIQIPKLNIEIHNPTGLVTLCNALLINNPFLVQQYLGNGLYNFLDFVFAFPLFPDTIVLMVKRWDFFVSLKKDEELLRICIMRLTDDILSKDSGDEFDQDTESDGVIIYDYGETLLLFKDLYSTLDNSIIRRVLCDADEEELEILGNIEKIANLYIQARDLKKSV